MRLGASNHYINELIDKKFSTQLSTKFLGVFSIDELKCEKDMYDMKEKLLKNQAGTTLIFNSSKLDEKGEHWLMLTKLNKNTIFLYDSFGLENIPFTLYGKDLTLKNLTPASSTNKFNINAIILDKKTESVSENYMQYFLFNCLKNTRKEGIKEQMQSVKSNLCGFYCVFIFKLLNEVNLNLNNLVDSLDKTGLKKDKEEENDKIIKNYFYSL